MKQWRVIAAYVVAPFWSKIVKEFCDFNNNSERSKRSVSDRLWSSSGVPQISSTSCPLKQHQTNPPLPTNNVTNYVKQHQILILGGVAAQLGGWSVPSVALWQSCSIWSIWHNLGQPEKKITLTMGANFSHTTPWTMFLTGRQSYDIIFENNIWK